MLKYLLLSITLLFGINAAAQTGYKDHNVCIASDFHKGKANHGKLYCVSSIIVREYIDGRKDTVAWMPQMKMFIDDEYEKYQRLSERGQYIVDSLKEDGIAMFQQSYLIYEPRYMKSGRKTYKSWMIQGDNVVMYYYSLWKNSKGSGVELAKEIAIK